MRTAIIGWGSLIWDLEILAPHVTGDWLMGAGPDLPMEFSRISPKRKMGLVVCLDPVDGVPCRTNVIASNRAELRQTVLDVAERERAPLKRIGWATADRAEGRLPAVNEICMEWVRRSEFDAAVWTDLDPNFAQVAGEPFSLPSALAHLKTLDPEQIEEAHRYIEEAPKATDTPLRRALAVDPWWQSLKEK